MFNKTMLFKDLLEDYAYLRNVFPFLDFISALDRNILEGPIAQ